MANSVEVKWKKRAIDNEWRGSDGQPSTEGFILLVAKPRGAPEEVVPDRKPMKSKYLKQLTGPRMTEVMNSIVDEETASASMAWLKESAITSVMPFTRVDPPYSHLHSGNDPRSQWGPKIKIGVPGSEGEFFLLEHSPEFGSNDRFWQIPDAAYDQRGEFARVDTSLSALPDVRYKGTKRRKTTHLSKSPVSSLTRTRSALSKLPGDKDAGGDDDDDDDKDQEPYTPAWGAPFTGCVISAFAVLLTEFDDSIGLSVVQITNIVSDAEGEESFQGVDLCIDSRTVNQSDEKCLKSPWYRPPRGKVSSEVRAAWGVLVYFQALLPRGRGKKGKGLPTDVINHIKRVNESEDLNLFTMKPEAVESLQKGYNSNDDYDDDDDSH